jgi:hypothetical protein
MALSRVTCLSDLDSIRAIVVRSIFILPRVGEARRSDRSCCDHPRRSRLHYRFTNGTTAPYALGPPILTFGFLRGARVQRPPRGSALGAPFRNLASRKP